MKNIIKKHIDKILDYFGYVDKEVVNFSKTFDHSRIIQDERKIIRLRTVNKMSHNQFSQLRNFHYDDLKSKENIKDSEISEQFKNRICKTMMFDLSEELLKHSKITMIQMPFYEGDGVEMIIELQVIENPF